ncbi:NAD(P)-binding protein, partial [Aureobasidium melanogenum]
MGGSTRGALVVVGSGPGIGSHVARTFSSHGFKRIILLSRDPSRLEQDADFIRSSTPSAEISTLPIDLAKTSEIPSALEQVDKALGDTPLEVVLFNAARVGPSTLVEWPMEELELDLRIKVTGCYAVVQWAIPKLLAVKSSHKPAFLCTSGSIYKDPIPEVFSLSVCKAAQHNLVHSMHKKYKEEGVYCGLVAVGGVVADDRPQCNAENIANKTWALYEQRNDLEVEIVDG